MEDALWAVLKWVFGGLIALGTWMVRRLISRVDQLERNQAGFATHEDVRECTRKATEDTADLRRDITNLGNSLRQEIREQVSFVVDVIRSK